MTNDTELDIFVINALAEKFMDGPGFFYGIISETLHNLVNNGENNENTLLSDGMMFLVEEGTEMAKSAEEVATFKIQKLMQMLQSHVHEFQFLSSGSLYKCCYE